MEKRLNNSMTNNIFGTWKANSFGWHVS